MTTLVCPNCESSNVRTDIIDDEFQYGIDGDAVFLKVALPVRICTDCKEQFLDHEGHQIRHDAIMKHLSNK